MSDASFAKIDYSIRPAKFAERKMLCEIFRRVGPFEPVEDYTYVGLGSVWFADFALFHRALGLKTMVSIERVKSAEARVEANKPFRTIAVSYDTSSNVLPNLDWKKRHLIWMDYDDPIMPEMLLDARTVSANALSGTIFAISVQCHKARELIEAEADTEQRIPPLDRLTARFERKRISANMMEDDLIGWRFGTLSRNMFRFEVEDALTIRNLTLPDEEKVRFHPICDFEYADGAKMTTIIGMFAAKKDRALVKQCAFNTLDFLPSSGRLLRIKVPLLTAREMRHLERQLPKAASGSWDLGSIPASEANLFANFYRYFPNFASVEH